jgi:alginate O-acetyltransferase complex protein AlgI
VHDGAVLLSGVLYQPYYLLTFAIAAVVVWAGPQTWDWTRKLGWAKVSICLLLLWTSLAALESQEFNPFIYFIF